MRPDRELSIDARPGIVWTSLVTTTSPPRVLPGFDGIAPLGARAFPGPIGAAVPGPTNSEAETRLFIVRAFSIIL